MRKRPEVSPEESSGRRNRAGYHGPRLPTSCRASARRSGSRPRAHPPRPRAHQPPHLPAHLLAASTRFVARRGRSAWRLRDLRTRRAERRGGSGAPVGARRGSAEPSRGRPSGSPGRPDEFGARSPDPRFGPGRRPAPAGAGRRFRFRSAGGRGSAAATERVATGSPEPSRDPGGWVGGRDPGDGFPDSGAGRPQAGGRRRASSASRQSSNRSSRMAARIRSVRRA